MRVMVLVKANAASERGEMPPPDLMDRMMAYNEELKAAGILVDADGLTPSSRGFRLYFDGDDRRVAQGPFAATDELVAGYWLWDVPSMEAALDWARKCPNPHIGPSHIEVRPAYTLEDFGQTLAPDIRERWERLEER
jgi:hypothetical protein